jgi:small GTP-binding protein
MSLFVGTRESLNLSSDDDDDDDKEHDIIPTETTATTSAADTPVLSTSSFLSILSSSNKSNRLNGSLPSLVTSNTSSKSVTKGKDLLPSKNELTRAHRRKYQQGTVNQLVNGHYANGGSSSKSNGNNNNDNIACCSTSSSDKSHSYNVISNSSNGYTSREDSTIETNSKNNLLSDDGTDDSETIYMSQFNNDGQLVKKEFNSNPVICHIIDVSEGEKKSTSVKTRRHSRYLLESNKVQRKRPMSQAQLNDVLSFEHSLALSHVQRNKHLTMHGSRLSARVYLGYSNKRQSISVMSPSFSYNAHKNRNNFVRLADPSRSYSSVHLGTQKIVLKNNRSNTENLFSLLPDELLFVLFTWMEPEDLGRIVTVCKRWHYIAEIDPLWESISNYYYPEETSKAIEQRMLMDNQILDYNNSSNNNKKKKSFLQRWAVKLGNASQEGSSFINGNGAFNLSSSNKFYKDIFVKAYTSDLVLLRTGIWKNPNWKPKKSPWSIDDYTFGDKLHSTILGSSSDVDSRGSVVKKGSIPIKVVVVGDGAVGKTSLLCRYANNYFPEHDFLPTIFDNFSTNTVYMNQTFNVSLWDTAGSEDYDRLRPLSYRGADIFMLCVDLVNAHSLQNGAKWLEELTDHAPGVPILLCGTKMDLRVNKEYIKEARKKNGLIQPVTFDAGCEYAKKIGAVAYTETSALTGWGVERAFEYIMRYGCEFFLAQQKFMSRKSSCGIA